MKNYEIIFITNLPAFYKLNLFNSIARQRKVLVVFTHEHDKQRNADFYEGVRLFDFTSIANKNTLAKLAFIHQMIRTIKYNQLILGGWDHPVMWYAAIKSNKKKNALLVESSIWESQVYGIKGKIKSVFLKRISKAYVSGKSQAALCVSLGYKSKLIKTKGVGIFNIQSQPEFQKRALVENFLYVGRLSPEKNLIFLVNTFNKLPALKLNIVGFGPQEEILKSMAEENIIFHGAVPNRELYKVYQQNDVFILPSTSEPWGMVVEEALNNGLPVIVSDRVGCAEEIVNETNGIVFKLNEPDSLLKAIVKMQDIVFYNSLRLNISRMDFEKIAEEQVKCYL